MSTTERTVSQHTTILTSERNALSYALVDDIVAHRSQTVNVSLTTIKQARQSKNLTQEELGNLIGVQRAQISRIENGKNLTFSTIARVFKAMGISAKLEIGSMGKVALW